IQTEWVETFFLSKKLMLYQPAQGFRAGLDAVMLGAAVSSPRTSSFQILDIGCGTGAAGLCALHRHPDARLTGIDILPAMTDMAAASAKRNSMQDRVRFLPMAVGGAED